MSRKAESIIKSLCRQEPSERIGYQKAGVTDIRKHRWFQGFDWEGLRAESLQAPMTPVIKESGLIFSFLFRTRNFFESIERAQRTSQTLKKSVTKTSNKCPRRRVAGTLPFNNYVKRILVKIHSSLYNFSCIFLVYVSGRRNGEINGSNCLV